MISETRINYYRFRNDTTWPGYGTDFGALLGIPNIGKGSMPNITGTTGQRRGSIPNVDQPEPQRRGDLQLQRGHQQALRQARVQVRL